jgi:hypothetical protein
MQERPTFPLLVIEDQGYLQLIEDESPLTRCNALGLIKGFYKKIRAYDSIGFIWIVEDVQTSFKINRLSKFLAFSIYNPSLEVSLSWKKWKNYGLEELKYDLKKRVDQDDDIITQFFDSDTIKNAIDESVSFNQLLQELNKLVFTESTS